MSLPDDIKTFYSFCNGLESEEDMFRIIPLSEIAEHSNELQPNQYYIAEYMIYCDSWVLEFDPNEPNNYKIMSMQQNGVYKTLTNSFVEFLNRFLQGGVFSGLYDWAKEKQ